ncbi:MAG: HAMP domain-containing methyl-accepting chemotaxis protein [Nitrososphaera sp.]
MVNLTSAISIATVSIVNYFSPSNVPDNYDVIRCITTGVIMQGVVGIAAYFAARSISRSLMQMTSIAEKVTKGDLTVNLIESKSNDEIAKLTNAFGDMISSLRQLVLHVKDGSSLVASNSEQVVSSTEQMNSSVQQISSTIDQISKGSQIQARELEETSRVVNRITSDMKKLASKAGLTADLTNEVGLISAAGSQSASEADSKMSKIISITNESSKKIKDLAERSNKITAVVDVIRKIADQTNLLALNAAIEAARAGESGRGFAVVADEVKRLAEGSAKSSKEIDILVKQIQEDAKSTVLSIESGANEVTEGRLVIDKALKALNEIASKVNEVSINVLDVANITKQQVGEIEQLSKATSEIAAVSEQNASATEEASAATEQQTTGTQEILMSIQRMACMAEDLTRVTAGFKLPQTQHLEKITRNDRINEEVFA